MHRQSLFYLIELVPNLSPHENIDAFLGVRSVQALAMYHSFLPKLWCLAQCKWENFTSKGELYERFVAHRSHIHTPHVLFNGAILADGLAHALAAGYVDGCLLFERIGWTCGGVCVIEGGLKGS